MSQSSTIKCPKCGGEMRWGSTAGDFRILKQGDLVGDRANAVYCINCGFVELYKEASTREPKRWRTLTTEPALEPTSEKQQKPPEPQEEPKPKTEKRLVR